MEHYGVKTVSNPPTNARERSTLAHTIHKCTQEIHSRTQSTNAREGSTGRYTFFYIIIRRKLTYVVFKAQQV